MDKTPDKKVYTLRAYALSLRDIAPFSRNAVNTQPMLYKIVLRIIFTYFAHLHVGEIKVA